MPTLKKTLHFSFSALSCAVGVALLGYGMSVEWSSSTVRCNSTGEAEVTLGLFQADGIFTNCPFNTEEQVDGKQFLRVCIFKSSCCLQCPKNCVWICVMV